MHAEDDGIQGGGDFFGEPAPGFREQPGFAEAGFGGFEDFVVGTGDVAAFVFQGNGEAVHGSPADSDKVDVHDVVIISFAA